jgi:hypothetical protein
MVDDIAAVLRGHTCRRLGGSRPPVLASIPMATYPGGGVSFHKVR